MSKVKARKVGLKVDNGISCKVPIDALKSELAKESEKLSRTLLAIALAYKELNTIRARDGVPYTHDGFKASVDEEYFSKVVDKLDEAMIEMTGHSAHLHPILYRRVV